MKGAVTPGSLRILFLNSPIRYSPFLLFPDTPSRRKNSRDMNLESDWTESDWISMEKYQETAYGRMKKENDGRFFIWRKAAQ